MEEEGADSPSGLKVELIRKLLHYLVVHMWNYCNVETASLLGDSFISGFVQLGAAY